MDVVAGIQILATLIQAVTNAAAQASQVSSIITGAQAQGRTTFTADEWAIIQGTQATSRQALVDAINKALASGV